jgi:hypothetical protein
VPDSKPGRSRRAAAIVLFLWALLFVGGALSEIFDLEDLRRATDPKRLVLR